MFIVLKLVLQLHVLFHCLVLSKVCTIQEIIHIVVNALHLRNWRGTIRVCCLRYWRSSWEILFSLNPLSNLSSPGKTSARHRHLFGVVGFLVLFDKPSSFAWIHLFGYTQNLQFIPRILEKDQVMKVSVYPK